MRSGTNVFCKYAERLKLNCVNDPFMNFNCDFDSYKIKEPPLCWKHSFPSLIDTTFPIVICMKDPISQYASLKKVWKKYGSDHHFSHAYKSAYKITTSVDDFIELYKKYVTISNRLSISNPNVHIVNHDEFCRDTKKYYAKIFGVEFQVSVLLGRIDPGLNQTGETFNDNKSKTKNLEYISKHELEKLEELNEVLL